MKCDKDARENKYEEINNEIFKYEWSDMNFVYFCEQILCLSH